MPTDDTPRTNAGRTLYDALASLPDEPRYRLRQFIVAIEAEAARPVPDSTETFVADDGELAYRAARPVPDSGPVRAFAESVVAEIGSMASVSSWSMVETEARRSAYSDVLAVISDRLARLAHNDSQPCECADCAELPRGRRNRLDERVAHPGNDIVIGRWQDTETTFRYFARAAIPGAPVGYGPDLASALLTLASRLREGAVE